MSYENCKQSSSIIPTDAIISSLVSKFSITSVSAHCSENKATINILFDRNSKTKNPKYSFFKSLIPFFKKQPKTINVLLPKPEDVLNEKSKMISNLSTKNIKITHNNATLSNSETHKLCNQKLY